MYKIKQEGNDKWYKGRDKYMSPMWGTCTQAWQFHFEHNCDAGVDALKYSGFDVEKIFIIDEAKIDGLFKKTEYLTKVIPRLLAPHNKGLRERLEDEARFHLGRMICVVADEYNPLKGELETWFSNIIRWRLITFIYKWKRQVHDLVQIEVTGSGMWQREDISERVYDLSEDARLVVGIVLSDRNRRPGNITVRQKLENSLRDRLGWSSSRIETAFLELQEEFA